MDETRELSRSEGRNVAQDRTGGCNPYSQRTGVLIMVSLLEHQIHVLADQSIAQRVPPERWASVVEAAVSELTRADIMSGLCQGIQVCGTLLAEVCPIRPGDNPDELSNELVIAS